MSAREPDPLRRVVAADSAATLGRAGRDIEAALDELRAASPAEREALEYRCARLVWEYFVQREACGINRHDEAIRHYGIPREVLSKIGATRRAVPP